LFFALSKTLGVMALPTNFLVGLGVVGALLCATRWAQFGRKLLVVTFVLLAVCAFSPLGNLLLYPLESRFPPWNPAQGAPDGIIVLGGPIDADLSVAHDTPVIRSAPDRIFAAAALARQYPNARIVFTGGSPNLIANDAREADYAATVFESLGIAKSRLIMERRSRNTYENAVFTRDMVQPKPGERWLLVTSAFHMPRSVGLFWKAGFPVEAYPVDWHVGRSAADILSFTAFANEGLSQTDVGVREWMGLIAYRLRGRTDALLPGPATN
jgi:uncharacterized SAM-binding protein YcdF (DUF218 family)